MSSINIDEIRKYIETPQLTIEPILPNNKLNKKFEWLNKYMVNKKVVGKQSKYNNEYYKWMLLTDDAKSDGSHFTPKIITHVINEYIKQSNFEYKTIIDFTSGIGALIYSINGINKAEKITLWDINQNSIHIAQEIATRLELNIETLVTDSLQYSVNKTASQLSLFDETPELEKYDLLVLNPPFNLTKSSNFDFLNVGVDMLEDNGKMFIILPMGCLSGQTNLEQRKKLIHSGLLESIFYFESGIFENTGIPTCMFVISKNNKEKTRLYNLDNLDLPIIEYNSKVNPISGRIYKRKRKDYGQFKFDINKYKNIVRKHDELENDRYILTYDWLLMDSEQEKIKMIENSRISKDNLEKLSEWSKPENNWFVQVAKHGIAPVRDELILLCLSVDNKDVKEIDLDKLYKDAKKSPLIFGEELEKSFEKVSINVLDLEKFRIECAFIKFMLINLLI